MTAPKLGRVERALAIVIGLLALGPVAPGAAAQEPRVVTWDAPSRYVDFSEYDLGGTPPHLPEPRALRVNVYLPEGYDGKRRFPVLYLLHGHGEGYADWADPRKGDVLRTAEGFPGIIVMPEGWRGWYLDWWNGGRRGGPAWERHHLDELIPLVEERLRIRRGRRWRAVAGWSMGGLGAMYYASQRPGYFGSAASFSGTISLERADWHYAFQTQGEDFEQVYGDRPFYVRGHNPTALIDNLLHSRLYATTGNGFPEPGDDGSFSVNEFYVLQHANDFSLAARLAGADLTYRPRDGRHEFLYWRQHFRDAAHRWGFFEPVSERPEAWTYETVAQQGEMWCLRFEFDEPPDVVQSFERVDGRLLGDGTGGVTITTRDGRSFSEPMPFEIRAPEAPCRRARAGARARLRLSARPRRVPSGRRTVMRFRVVHRSGSRVRPVDGAVVRFAGQSATTAPTGRARMTVRFRRTRDFVARATHPGFRSGEARIRVVRAPRSRG